MLLVFKIWMGLTAAEAAWANRKYHGHRTLPPDILHSLRSPKIV